jgi:hypothetical protein
MKEITKDIIGGICLFGSVWLLAIVAGLLL